MVDIDYWLRTSATNGDVVVICFFFFVMIVCLINILR